MKRLITFLFLIFIMIGWMIYFKPLSLSHKVEVVSISALEVKHEKEEKIRVYRTEKKEHIQLFIDMLNDNRLHRTWENGSEKISNYSYTLYKYDNSQVFKAVLKGNGVWNINGKNYKNANAIDMDPKYLIMLEEILSDNYLIESK